VESQEELRQLLQKQGWTVTQSTLSRDLREMRVARIPGEGGLARYALTDAPAAVRPSLASILPRLFTRIDGVGELVVLHTRVAGGQQIGVALDAAGWSDILGTIAGDDTVLIVCAGGAARERVQRRLEAIVRKGIRDE